MLASLLSHQKTTHKKAAQKKEQNFSNDTKQKNLIIPFLYRGVFNIFLKFMRHVKWNNGLFCQIVRNIHSLIHKKCYIATTTSSLKALKAPQSVCYSLVTQFNSNWCKCKMSCDNSRLSLMLHYQKKCIVFVWVINKVFWVSFHVNSWRRDCELCSFRCDCEREVKLKIYSSHHEKMLRKINSITEAPFD